MKSRMHPKYYLCSEIFNQEQEKIFKKMWIFAGLKSLLLKNNNFIARKMAGIPVVIQNFNGTLRAFENVCLHRSALLQTEFTGCRPLVCAYHAWKYDASGQASNIPHCEKLYQFSDDEKKSLKLREFAVRTVGSLVFINLSDEPFPLEEQFSADFLSALEDSSNAYDCEVMMTTWHCKFNWKLPYENLRDFNHVVYLHPRSLAPFVDLYAQVNAEAAEESLQPLADTSAAGLRREISRYSYGGAPEGGLDQLRSHEWHNHIERWRASHRSGAAPQTDDAYFNWLAFPNLHIASGDGGHTFTIEHHIPIAPDRTDIEVYYMSARKKQKYAASTQVLLTAMHAGQAILKEDFDILEQVQDALHLQAPLPVQGAYESTNRLIERWYTTLMEDKHASL